MKAQRHVALLLSAYFGVAACRQIIGIEDAQVDPSVSKAKSAGGAGSSMGGSQGPAVATADAGAAPGADPGSATTGGAAGQAGEAGSGAAPASLCQRYCAAVTTNCVGVLAVYTSNAACLSVCAALPEGQPGDHNVNSVQCRLQAALVATNDLPRYCPIAGPGGNGECGSNCQGLCALRARICTSNAGDEPACLASCAKLADAGTYSTDPSKGQFSGPQVECRLYHVSAAALGDAEHHCPQVDGVAPCR